MHGKLKNVALFVHKPVDNISLRARNIIIRETLKMQTYIQHACIREALSCARGIPRWNAWENHKLCSGIFAFSYAYRVSFWKRMSPDRTKKRVKLFHRMFRLFLLGIQFLIFCFRMHRVHVTIIKSRALHFVFFLQSHGLRDSVAHIFNVFYIIHILCII